jgi:hypothetical protein
MAMVGADKVVMAAGTMVLPNHPSTTMERHSTATNRAISRMETQLLVDNPTATHTNKVDRLSRIDTTMIDAPIRTKVEALTRVDGAAEIKVGMVVASLGMDSLMCMALVIRAWIIPTTHGAVLSRNTHRGEVKLTRPILSQHRLLCQALLTHRWWST